MARERKAHYEASFFVVGQAGRGRVSEVEDGEMELVGILGETMENSLLIPNDLSSSGEREKERAIELASEPVLRWLWAWMGWACTRDLLDMYGEDESSIYFSITLFES